MPITDDAPAFERQGFLKEDFRLFHLKDKVSPCYEFHVHGGVYQAAAINMPWGIWPELKDHRFKGNFFGAGISYGYQWILAKHWNLEGNIGVGYARVKYEQFECKTCGEKVSEGHKNYLGPTKAAISLIYLF